jgi:hypothetical protein
MALKIAAVKENGVVVNTIMLDEAEDPANFNAEWYEIVDNSTEAAYEFAANSIREERDKRLADCDWWALTDIEITPDQLAYRQALRDITNQETFPTSVNWPIKP